MPGLRELKRQTVLLPPLLLVSTLYLATLTAQTPQADTDLIPIADGWARNQVNAVIFRRNSVTSHGQSQYVAFYDASSRVIVARRRLGARDWQTKRTRYTGNAEDAHNSISIAVDGDGFLHMAWNHHASPLQYCRSVRPGSLLLLPMVAMVGKSEDRVTYPEFYSLPNGDLLFTYRDGVSGGGNLVLNRYDLKKKRWTRLQDKLIDGQGDRNAYPQMAIDAKGTIHLSWVWRETPDVATNHDMGYAKSTDGGKTWLKSSGQKYQLPITASTAEYAWRIQPGSELINQTSMSADALGRPYIATYFRPPGELVPQYHVIYHDGEGWRASQVTHRTTPFSLSGQGTRRIPISRPQILVRSSGARVEGFMVFRDSERGNRVSVAVSRDIISGAWLIRDLTKDSVGMWEPTYDEAVWKKWNEIHLLVQRVGQGEGESLEDIPAQMVFNLVWVPKATP
jgi:hypothetical protein